MHIHQPREPVPDGFIVARQVAQILGINSRYLYDLTAQGRLPAGKRGKFCFTSETGKVFSSSYCWNEEEIRAVAKEGIPAPRPPGHPTGARTPIPSGWLKASDAAQMLGTTINTLVCRSESGGLPMYRWHQYTTETGIPRTVRIWNEQELRAHMPRKPEKKCLPGELQALLSRLWSKADGVKVDGDATDIILGNPARPSDWESIEALAKAGCLEWSLDGWDRLEIALNPDWQPDESGSWRCFG